MLWKHFLRITYSIKYPTNFPTRSYVLYTDYKSDYTDEYTVMMDYKLSHLNKIPSGFTGRAFKLNTFSETYSRRKNTKERHKYRV